MEGPKVSSQNTQNTGKRSFTIPIILVLLVFSVTSNVLLYTKNIQHNQERLEQRGIQIFQTVVKSKEHSSELAEFTSVLLEEQKSNADKARAKAAAAAVFLAADKTLVQLQQYAEESPIEGVSLTGAGQNAEQFVQKASAAFHDIGAKSGAWSVEEEQLIAELNDKYKQILDQLSGFPFSIEGFTTSMIRLANGYELAPIAEKVNNVLAQ